MTKKDFGKKVLEKAAALAAGGKDVNQIANILFKQDPDGRNYGIGILLGGDGNPLQGSPILMEYLLREIQGNTVGQYFNSAALMQEVKKSVLQWQRVPEMYWDNFTLVVPSDAGTGAVRTGLETLLSLFPCLGI